jgi:hypothetical protein
VHGWEENIKMDLKAIGIEGIMFVVTWKGQVGGWTGLRQEKATITLVILRWIMAEM